MALTLHWHGHSAWTLESDGVRLLIDPFFTGNPAADIAADEAQADYIILTHAHGDHLGDIVSIAQRTGATIIGNFEVSVWLGQQNVEKAIGMNPGGGTTLPFGRVTFTRADHSSSFPDGTYGGVACGFVIQFGGHTIYNTGDTALFSDMKLIGERHHPDIVLLPIGDFFTMGPEDSVEALRLIGPQLAFPQHYNTWPPISQDGGAWATLVQQILNIEGVVLEPGQDYILD